MTSKIIELWGDNLPASAIGLKLNMTRNTVIGRIDRLRRSGDPATLAADARRGQRLNRMDQVAEWMADHGGRVCECAKAIGLDPESTRKAWQRVCLRMGEQAI